MADHSVEQHLRKLFDRAHHGLLAGARIRLVWQFLNRTIGWGGLYREVRRGISRGLSLSPLLGAFSLLELDKRMEGHDVKFFRYMDDILILAPTRWKLKKAVKALNQTFQDLKLEKHPAKTVMGRTKKGFDFLGYHFSPQGLRLAEATVQNFRNKIHRLYEQQKTAPEGAVNLGEYIVRWRRWTHAGLLAVDLHARLTHFKEYLHFIIAPQITANILCFLYFSSTNPAQY